MCVRATCGPDGGATAHRSNFNFKKKTKKQICARTLQNVAKQAAIL